MDSKNTPNCTLVELKLGENNFAKEYLNASKLYLSGIEIELLPTQKKEIELQIVP